MSTIELKPLRSRSETRPGPAQGLGAGLASDFARPSLSLLPLLRRVEQAVMPVWPLQDYVAVNPWAGLAGEQFLEARRKLRAVSECELLMPLAFYLKEYHKGSFTREDVEEALNERQAQSVPQQPNQLAAQVWQALGLLPGEAVRSEHSPSRSSKNSERNSPRVRLKTISELADSLSAWSWSEWLQGELTKFCSAYFDRGQAIWNSPDRKPGIWAAWKRQAKHDRNPAWWGLGEVALLAEQLPLDEVDAIAALLEWWQVPATWRERFLTCQVLAMPGWFAWARRQGGWTSASDDCNREFVGLLAIRVVYELALARRLNLTIDWKADSGSGDSGNGRSQDEDELAEVRAVLLRASELNYRRLLLDRLRLCSDYESKPTHRPPVQMVFCIDVRSERLRRNLEALAPGVQTLGFAGFFGMPFEYRRFGTSLEREGESQLPVLLQPQFAVQEEFGEAVLEEQHSALDSQVRFQFWQTSWKQFQTSLASCFSSVETTGWVGAWRMLCRSFASRSRATPEKSPVGMPGVSRNSLGPSLRGLNAQGWSTSRQVDLAEGMLRNLGLLENFSRLVVLCGHRCEVENNPLRAGLDCGACGGHSGEANARFAALLLNQEFVRQGLAERGIAIPGDTWFLASVHQTTSDEVEFPDGDLVPFSHGKDFALLREYCRQAGELVAAERGDRLGLGTLSSIRQRVSDWSEVRPEWGLVGNAALVAGPRSLTRGKHLDGRVFLHEYDYHLDPQGKVLELILTAPLIVASWINLQYYASAVDPKNYGSGCKTIHNVVGKFGILSGVAGDLQTGLPWQSVGWGTELLHSPLRLQAVIAAPRSRIERIVAGHQHLRDLLFGGWIYLCALDEGAFWQLDSSGDWRQVS
ncbi:MAG: YbcC family protein [Planctomycetota bacterium]